MGTTHLKRREFRVEERVHKVETCGEEFYVNSNSSCVSAYVPAHCSACPVVSGCHLLDSARLLTHPDDQFNSALSQLKTFAHLISQSIHICTLKLYTRCVRRAPGNRSAIEILEEWSRTKADTRQLCARQQQRTVHWRHREAGNPEESELPVIERNSTSAAVAERSGSSTAVAAQRGNARDG